MNTSLRRLALSAFAAGALLSALPAQAIGRLANVHLIDRDSGETLPVYRHRGEHWVAGRPGARYAISVRNAQPNRLMGVHVPAGVGLHEFFVGGRVGRGHAGDYGRRWSRLQSGSGA